MTSFLVMPTSRRRQHWSKLLAIGVVSGWLGVVGLPATTGAQLPLTQQAAIAQSSISNEEVTQYARAVLAIDRYRNAAYTQIKDILLTVEVDISAIDMSCTNTQNISEVPRSVRREVREILTRYCNDSRQAVEDTGLTPRRFNQITDAHAADETVFERIQQELLRLQEAQ
jgi:hypothetical protein